METGTRHSISLRIRWCALAALLAAAPLPAQQAATRPDPVLYGNHLEMGDLAQVREWLEAGLDPNALADRIGTGLMVAAWRGDIPMMELLVARGADVNFANALGERALMHAAWRGQTAAVKWLLARGARVNGEPMHWSALHYAVFAGHGEIAELLLQSGADINARSTNGSSVLMMAVYEGHEALARRLLARGADPSLKNDRGDGALEWAFKFNRLSIARLVATPQQFVAAASQPKSEWGEAQRSEPAPEATPVPADTASAQIDELMGIRKLLAARGLDESVDRLDRRIAALRAQRARAERATPAAVLEISASRRTPEDQKARLILERGAPPEP